jgi:hypothetical protein
MIHLQPQYRVTGNLEEQLAQGHQQSQTARGLANLLKDNAAARSIAMLPPHLQQAYTQQLMHQQGALQGQNLIARALAGQEEEFPQIQQSAPQPIQNLMEQMQPQQEQQMQAPVEFGLPPQSNRLNMLQMLAGQGMQQQPVLGGQQPVSTSPMEQQVQQSEFPRPEPVVQQMAEQQKPVLSALEKAEKRLNALTALAGTVDASALAPHLENARREIDRLEKREVGSEKTQTAIEKHAQEYFEKTLAPRKDAAENFITALDDLEALVKQYPDYFGTAGSLAKRLIPIGVQGEIKTAIENVALQKFAKTPGASRGTKAMLETVKGTKPNQNLTPEANLKLIDTLKRAAKMEIAGVNDFEAIRRENPGSLPKNYTTLWEEKMETPPADLPDPATVPQGLRLVDPETGRSFVAANGKWRATR